MDVNDNQVIIELPEDLRNNEAGINEFKSINSNVKNAVFQFRDEISEPATHDPETTTETDPGKPQEWFKKLGHETEEEFTTHYNTLKEKSTKADALEPEYQKTKKDLDNLSKKLDAVKSPFVNDKFFKLNELAKTTGKEDLSILSKILDIDSQSDIDTILLKKVYDNPKNSEKLDLLRESVLERYDLQRPDDYDEMDEDAQKKVDHKIEIRKLALEDEANKIRAEFKKQTDSIKLPEAIDETAKANNLKAEKERLAPNVKAVLNNDFKTTIKIGEDYEFDIVIPKDIMTKYEDPFTNLILQSDKSDKSLQDAYNTLINLIIPEQLPSILKSLRTKMDEETKTKIDLIKAEYINPSKPKRVESSVQDTNKNRNLTDDEIIYGKDHKKTFI